MEINLKLGTYSFRRPSYNLDDDVFLCFSALSDYFELSDNPKEITVVIKNKPHKNSYFVNTCGGMGITVKDSKDCVDYYHVNERVPEFLNKIGGSAWVSIVA